MGRERCIVAHALLHEGLVVRRRDMRTSDLQVYASSSSLGVDTFGGVKGCSLSMC